MEKVSLSGLSDFAKRVSARIERSPQDSARAYLVALRGDLGAGKTTFVQALARDLGIEETVQSPTYVLMKSYPISFANFETLIHIDAYRLEDPGEFKTLKPETFLGDPHALILIEWPERAQGALPEPDLAISFYSEGAGAEERFVEIG